MIYIVPEVCHSFLRPEFIDQVVNAKEFQEIRTEQELPDNELLIGKETRTVLRNDRITAVQRARFFQRVRLFFRQLLSSLLHYLLIGRRLLKTIRFIDPSQKENISESDIVFANKKLCRMR
jgi:hypothetical protein